MPVIGFLHTQSPGSFGFQITAFHAGLSESGFVEDRNVAVEYRPVTMTETWRPDEDDWDCRRRCFRRKRGDRTAGRDQPRVPAIGRIDPQPIAARAPRAATLLAAIRSSSDSSPASTGRVAT
jgi:hypothetical protein